MYALWPRQVYARSCDPQMGEHSKPAPETVPTPAIRRMLFAILLVGLAGMVTELLLSGHYDGATQRVPLLLLAAAVVVIMWHLLAPGAASVRALQFSMVLCLSTGLIGVGYHYVGNEASERERSPGVDGFALIRQSLTGETPVLAPGSLVLLGLVGLTYAHRHPILVSHQDDSVAKTSI